MVGYWYGYPGMYLAIDLAYWYLASPTGTLPRLLVPSLAYWSPTDRGTTQRAASRPACWPTEEAATSPRLQGPIRAALLPGRDRPVLHTLEGVPSPLGRQRDLRVPRPASGGSLCRPDKLALGPCYPHMRDWRVPIRKRWECPNEGEGIPTLSGNMGQVCTQSGFLTISAKASDVCAAGSKLPLYHIISLLFLFFYTCL